MYNTLQFGIELIERSAIPYRYWYSTIDILYNLFGIVLVSASVSVSVNGR